MLGAFFRLLSSAYHFFLSLFLFLIGVIGHIGGKADLSLPMLPWSGVNLLAWITGLGLIGLVISALAARGKFPWLFLLWCVFVLTMIVRGFFLGSYYYTGGSGEFTNVLLLFAGAVMALVVSALTVRRKA
jgi:hypothetical protein